MYVSRCRTQYFSDGVIRVPPLRFCLASLGASNTYCTDRFLFFFLFFYFYALRGHACALTWTGPRLVQCTPCTRPRCRYDGGPPLSVCRSWARPSPGKISSTRARDPFFRGLSVRTASSGIWLIAGTRPPSPHTPQITFRSHPGSTGPGGRSFRSAPVTADDTPVPGVIVTVNPRVHGDVWPFATGYVRSWITLRMQALHVQPASHGPSEISTCSTASETSSDRPTVVHASSTVRSTPFVICVHAAIVQTTINIFQRKNNPIVGDCIRLLTPLGFRAISVLLCSMFEGA